jgi:hypothetical protein
MDTNDLKRLIGSECLVIDPRSRNGGFVPATIVGCSFSAREVNGKIYEGTSFEVELHKLTVTKKNRYGETRQYHRSFKVRGGRIQIPPN